MNRNKEQKDQNTGKEGSVYLTRLERETGIRLTGPEPLAAMNYHDEIRAKDRAFSTYWNGITSSCNVSAIVPSPLPRKYRTTTKRRIHHIGKEIILCSDETTLSDKPSALEPDSHAKAYTFLSGLLNSPSSSGTAKALNFIIIRGDYVSNIVIFNVKKINADIVKGCTSIAEKLKQYMENLISAFIFHDPEGSRYYLNTSSETEGIRLKRIFGSRILTLETGNIIYCYSPECFSQVNLSVCDALLATSEALLSPVKDSRLIDLYCGYGFFTCYLSGLFSEVTGVDFSGASIDSARENMKSLKQDVKWTFHAKKIDARSLNMTLPEPGMPEYIILDPPRNGTAPGVIETVAARNPVLVLHVFCGIETIPGELERWGKTGYLPVQCVPVDMFPGTPDIEVMVLLKKSQSVKTPSRSKSGR
jgi:tRNA/tmRNA/rRNA uracil-C5-methylase (TrmA/RlmC/RlmD family)